MAKNRSFLIVLVVFAHWQFCAHPLACLAISAVKAAMTPSPEVAKALELAAKRAQVNASEDVREADKTTPKDKVSARLGTCSP